VPFHPSRRVGFVVVRGGELPAQLQVVLAEARLIPYIPQTRDLNRVL
jgi:hypothetical protein